MNHRRTTIALVRKRQWHLSRLTNWNLGINKYMMHHVQEPLKAEIHIHRDYGGKRVALVIWWEPAPNALQKSDAERALHAYFKNLDAILHQ